MENKQTVIQWLFNKITQNEEIRWRGTQYRDLFEQAQQMHKEQMIEFANTYGTRVCNHDYENGEQYYNETFKQQDK